MARYNAHSPLGGAYGDKNTPRALPRRRRTRTRDTSIVDFSTGHDVAIGPVRASQSVGGERPCGLSNAPASEKPSLPIFLTLPFLSAFGASATDREGPKTSLGG